MDLAADNLAQPCHDVAAKPMAAGHDAEALPFEFEHAVTRDILGSDDRHPSGPLQQITRTT
jgi:hypothetical protein